MQRQKAVNLKYQETFNRGQACQLYMLDLLCPVTKEAKIRDHSTIKHLTFYWSAAKFRLI